MLNRFWVNMNGLFRHMHWLRVNMNWLGVYMNWLLVNVNWLRVYMNGLRVGVHRLGHVHRLRVGMDSFVVNMNRLSRNVMVIRLVHFNRIDIASWSVNHYRGNGLNYLLMGISWLIVIMLENMDWLGHVHWFMMDMNGLRVSVDRFSVYMNKLNSWINFGVLMNRLWVFNFWVQIMLLNSFMNNNWLWMRVHWFMVHGFMVNVMCLHLVMMMWFIKFIDLELIRYLQVVTVHKVMCMVVVSTYMMLIVHKNGNMHNNRVRWFGQIINLKQVLEVSLSVQEVDRWLENAVGADILE